MRPSPGQQQKPQLTSRNGRARVRFARSGAMMRTLRLLLVTAAALFGPAEAHQSGGAFHHLHLLDPAGRRTVEFYQRLFEPALTRRFSTGTDEGLQAGAIALVVSARSSGRPHRSAIWHYGWGEVSLAESYLDHNLREVAWQPPLPTDAFHVHVESVSPNSAALWYRDQFGARVVLAAPFEDDATTLDDRRPRAIAWIGTVAMVFYRSEDPLGPTRGQRADHIAVQVDDMPATFARLISAEAVEIESPRVRDGVRSAMVEGPDRMAIELVEK
ncbi:MAG: VOC family protein [Vicinamibacterales bacterium]